MSSLKTNLLLGVIAITSIFYFVMPKTVGSIYSANNFEKKPVEAFDTESQRGSAEIPRILHFTVFGEAKDYMLKTIEWSEKKVAEDGIVVKVWSIDDVERDLMPLQDEGIQKAWQYIKDPEIKSEAVERLRLTRLSDFARVVIIHEFGGSYMDADTLPCRGLNSLFDEQSMASFPYTQFQSGQVLNLAISAPPKHPQLAKTLELWKEMGSDIGIGGILDHTGPALIAKSVDEYFQSAGITAPSISDMSFTNNDFPEQQGTWIRLGDVRLGRDNTLRELGMVHIGFRSWIRKDMDTLNTQESPCIHDTNLIFPFLDQVCGDEILFESVFAHCGTNIQ